MWFLYLVGIIIVIMIAYGIAQEFARIAEMKGHDGKPYFWFTFLFGIAGMLMVIALPTKSENNSSKAVVTLPPLKNSAPNIKPRTATDTVKRCPYCGDIVKSGRCEMCGKEVK